MTQSVELLLDDALDEAIRSEWTTLEQAGLPSMARHTSETNRPHITLGVASEISDPVEVALTDLTDRLPLPIRLGSMICFTTAKQGHYILVRSVVPSLALLTLQAAAAERMRALPGTAAYQEPGAWTAHVTLARDVPAEKVADVLQVLGGGSDLTGTAVAIRRWDSVARRAWLLKPAAS